MGKGGRPRKPTRLKIIQGTYRADRAGLNEPDPEPVAPKCPTFLKGQARREWKRISEHLEGLGLLTQIDLAALASYCLAWETLIESDKVIRAEGRTILTPNGSTQQHPELSIRNRAMDQVRMFLTEFGMSPASRTRINLPPKDLDINNPFAQLGTG